MAHTRGATASRAWYAVCSGPERPGSPGAFTVASVWREERVSCPHPDILQAYDAGALPGGAAEFLELPASTVLDTATFYEEFFLEPRGKYTIWVCQSVSCEIMGNNALGFGG